MDQKLDQRRDQLDALEIQETELQEENTAQLVQLAILSDDIDNIIRQAKVHEAEIMNAASDEVHDLLLELEQSKQHAHTLENERNSAQAAASRYRDSALQTGLILQVTKDQHKRTRKELESSHVAERDLQTRNRALYDQNAALSKSHEQLSQDFSLLDAEKDDVERKFSLLEGQHGLLEQQHRIAAQEGLAKKRMIDDLEGKFSLLQDQHGLLRLGGSDERFAR